MRRCIPLQRCHLFLVKSCVAKKALAQLGELIECSSVSVKISEGDLFHRTVSAYGWYPAEQTVSCHLTWNGTLVGP